MLSDSRWHDLPEHGLRSVSVGHTAELDQLTRLLDDVPGRSRAAVVSGEPWIGKTRLLNEFIRIAVVRGWTVASGYAVHRPRRTPFADLTAAFAGAGCRSCGRNGDGLVAGHPCPLVGRASRSAGRPGSERTRECGVLDVLDAGGRLVLVLDDLHWADDATVNVLATLARLPGPGRLRVVAAFRPRQARFGVWRMLADSGATHVELAPLTAEETSALLPPGLDPARSRALTALAEGNPGLLCGLAATWLDELPGRPAEDAVPDYVRDVDPLSSQGWLALRSAALLGEPFELEPLARVAQMSRGDVLVAVSELVHHDLVRWEPNGRALRFRNPLLRILAERSAGPEWWLGAHLRGTENLPVDIGSSPRRASFVPRPSRPRPGAAVGQEDDGFERELATGEWLVTTGRLAESLELFADLGDLAVRTGRPPPVLARVAWWRARTMRLVGRYGEAYGELGAALDALPRGELDLRARLARARLAVAVESGMDTGGLAEVVAEMVRAGPSPSSRVHALALLAIHDVRRHHVEQAEHRVSLAVSWLGEIPGRSMEQLDALEWLGMAAAAVARPEIAAWCFRRGLGLAHRHGITTAIPGFAAGLGELEVSAGELAQAVWHQSLARQVVAYVRGDFLPDAVIRLDEAIERSAKDGAPLAQLSPRELDVARLVGDGQTNQQIARALGLSHRTVETYLTRIFKKLDASSRSQVAAEIGRTHLSVEVRTPRTAPAVP